MAVSSTPERPSAPHSSGPGFPSTRASAVLGWLGTFLVHGFFLVGLGGPPAVDVPFELTLPSEVELGMTEEQEAATTPLEAAPPPEVAEETEPETPPRRRERDRRRADAGVPDGGVDGGVDAGMPDLGLLALVDAGVRDAAALPVANATVSGPSRLPPGAQIAIRIDMARVRTSPLAPDIRQLVTSIPDWELLIQGSGIDPVEDLDRLLIASPNLQRSRLVLAGRHRRDASYARDAAARIAADRGVEIRWRQESGVPVVPWANRDETERVLALLGPQHFAVTRPEDLPRVLALAHARAGRRSRHVEVEDASGADALLSMGPDEGLSIEVEGIHRFVRGATTIVPTHGRLAIRQVDNRTAIIEAVGFFATPAEAEAATATWDRIRVRYASNPWVALSGLGSPLRQARLWADGDAMRFEVTLGVSQLRVLIAYAAGALGAVPPTPEATPP